MDPKAKAALKKERKEKKRLKKQQRSPAAKFAFTVLKIMAVLLIAITCAVVGIVGGAIYGYIKTTPPITDEQLQISNFTSFIYDKDGNQISQLHGTENRVWVYYDQIPKNLVNAFVAIEDERFWQHGGVDFKRVLSAIVSVVKPGSHVVGGSTITMQLVRNLTNQRQLSLQRKVQEQWSAIQLEKRLEKWQILELYLNVIPTGHGCYGVETAAKTYFNKDVKDLDLAESASIAGITNAPTYYDPLAPNGGAEHNKKRQELILKAMLDQKYITQEQYDQAINEKLNFNQGSTKDLTTASTQSYFVDQVVLDVKKDLMAKGLSEQIALKTIYNNGLKIYTTMDSNVQKAVDSVYNDPKYFPSVAGKSDPPQSGMVIVDPKTSQVRAMYGGNGQKKGNSLNRATQIARQVGSSMKPIAVYGPQIDQGLITPATVVDDVPVHLDSSNKSHLYPQNDDNSYAGLTTVRDAVARSVNVVTAQLYMKNPDVTYPYLKKVGINRDDERYLSVALGGLKNGLSPLQMAAAYVPFDNNGVYTEPITYTKVVDNKGNVLLEKKPKSNAVYKETTAYIMTSIMQSVVQYGTAYPYGIIKNSKGQIIPTAGKTGTTDNQTDRWFVGFSSYYVGAVWYGYDTPTRLEGMYNKNPSLQIWSAVMAKIHANLAPVNFKEPANIVHQNICIYSGKIPTALCSKDPRNVAGERQSIRNEIFVKGTQPTDSCDVHVQAKVAKNAKDATGRYLLAGPNTPLSDILEQVFIQRKIEYKPQFPSDPYPTDWKYELPAGEFDNVSPPPADKKTDSNAPPGAADVINGADNKNKSDGDNASGD
ncbi:MAG: PBP1A family penicillin-binding protein [Bacillota bacterium]|nr:PBP1A family penicillin-binding protein [Bacillota bacterium]